MASIQKGERSTWKQCWRENPVDSSWSSTAHKVKCRLDRVPSAPRVLRVICPATVPVDNIINLCCLEGQRVIYPPLGSRRPLLHGSRDLWIKRSKKSSTKNTTKARRSPSVARSISGTGFRKTPKTGSLSMKTRSAVKAQAIEEAGRILVKSIVTLSSSRQIDNFVLHSGYNEALATAVETLIIQTPSCTLASIRAILERTPSVEELVLDLPTKSHSFLALPNPFSRLVAFSTTLPHATLFPFLQMHNKLEALTIGPCGGSATCPLAGVSLTSLSELSCPPKCVTAISPVTRIRNLTATVHDRRDAEFDLSLLLNFTPIPTLSTLTILHINFKPSDVWVMAHIAAAAPQLIHLKLVETPFCKK
ncbi:hypothetical protein OF83DRAFT_1087623, partial [Amylostereum chailletii]